VRGGVGATLRTQNEEIRLQPLENRSVWGSNCLPQGGEAVLPLPRGFGGRSDGTCRRCRGAPRCLRGTRRRPWHAPLLTQAAPRRACSSAASAALGDGGGGVHLSRGAHPPSLSSFSSNDDEYSEAAGGESPCCLRSRYSSSLCSRHSCRRILCSFLRITRSCSRRCAARVRACGLGAWAGRTTRCPWPPSARNNAMSDSLWCVVRESKKGGACSPLGHREA
jgi:hypothetical protein